MITIAGGISDAGYRSYGRKTVGRGQSKYSDRMSQYKKSRAANTDTGMSNTKAYNFRREAEFRRAEAGSAERGRRKVVEARREAAARRRIVTNKRRIFLAVLIILLFSATVGVIYKLVFVVDRINVEGGTNYSAEEIIDASGVYEGINLYSFRRSTVVNKITLACPYVGSVDIRRNIPNSVDLILTDDTAAYYTVIFGEYKILSEGLRVLDTVENPSEIPEGLMRIKLPSVKYSVTGRVIEFADAKYDRIVRSVLSDVKDAELASRITSIDLRDQFDISMVCDSLYKLMLGEGDDIPYKLKTAALVLQDKMFDGEKKAKIDLTIRDKTGVRIDELLDTE